MKIEWEQEIGNIPVAPFALVADCCQAAEAVRIPCAVHVLMTDDSHIRAMNAQYRGIDRATDVLSFPTVNYARGKTARNSEKRLRAEFDPELKACMLGDILISLKHAQAQAAEYGHSVKRELCYLFAHGLFHLMGYDHMDPTEQKEMRQMEEKALHMAGISRVETSAAPSDEELPCAVHVLMTDDSHIRAMNAQYRGIDRATDVLSFPTVNYARGKTARNSEKRLRAEFDPELKACMLGDILISLKHAQAQAAEYGHSVKRELCYLFAHGLFHLMGYDHMDPTEQKEMRQMEEKALHMAGISRVETSAAPSDEELLALARLATEKSYAPYSKYRVGAALLLSLIHI